MEPRKMSAAIIFGKFILKSVLLLYLSLLGQIRHLFLKIHKFLQQISTYRSDKCDKVIIRCAMSTH
jgi:hypothetical protein